MARTDHQFDLSVSPYLPTVPLEGSERVVGLNQLQRLLRQAPLYESEHDTNVPASGGWRARDSIFQAPLSSLRTKLNRRCHWVCFWHANMDTAFTQAYSIPGTVPALCQRMDCNISEFVVRFVLAWCLNLKSRCGHPLADSLIRDCTRCVTDVTTFRIVTTARP
jgi:hypothetical protein